MAAIIEDVEKGGLTGWAGVVRCISNKNPRANS
jgi:hypothetical protein